MNELFRALPALLKEYEDSQEVREAVIFAAWRKIAGETLRERAVPHRLFKKHLVIAVMSDTWKKHLEHLSGQMIFKLNSVLGSAVVTYIEFRVDEQSVLNDRAKHKSPVVSNENIRESAAGELTAKLRHSADAIKDEHLRYQFLMAAGSCLARKKIMKEKDSE
ncbi:MAG: hypothetical protein JWN60_1008 [Acidobacteria bacterium]|jgi:hypothetical protein|nr:hypothetical protein [Acidobacteriota bacterium]